MKTLLLYAATAMAVHAQAFTTLVYFNYANGADPVAPLIQGPDGEVYGTTYSGGAAADGTFFKISSGGVLTTLYNFSGIDGSTPVGGVILGSDGNFYGTTEGGGPYGYGTIFKVTPSGNLTTLYSFGDASGEYPMAPLVEASNGDFYGTTSGGHGTVFKITPGGTFTNLHGLGGTYEEGTAALIQAADGNLYGTTVQGGTNNLGLIFKMTLAGEFTIIHSISADEGQYPTSALVQNPNGIFYGTTAGGANNGGTVFSLTSTGEFATLYTFNSSSVGPGGSNPSEIILGIDGNLYGTTRSGGEFNCSYAYNCGTIFRITPDGILTTLFNTAVYFGGNPGSLVQATSGLFWGTSGQAGILPYGSVFTLSVAGLGAFIETVPASGGVGSDVRIVGTDLTGASAVDFNGTPAAFTVVSAYEITTSVPIGAASGRVRVLTPTGVLLSNKPFRITR